MVPFDFLPVSGHFPLGEELMSAGLDAVMRDARTRAWDAARYAPLWLTLDFDATLLVPKGRR